MDDDWCKQQNSVHEDCNAKFVHYRQHHIVRDCAQRIFADVYRESLI